MARYIYFHRVWGNPFAVHVCHIADENDQPLCRVRYSGDNRFRIDEGKDASDNICRRCLNVELRNRKKEAA